MKKSPVAGISGSIRAVCLSKANLTAAEKHGKRLDATSQGRAVSSDPPLTNTGLDLWKLYRQHVSDAFVPKCRTVAKHIIVQFPKDLVDGEDAKFMLHHARKIVESIFGDQSIFADRVDRDEKGRHIVDIFVAPKYIKKTLLTEQLAVSVSVHEEALAEKYKRPNYPSGRGQAMQDAVFAYFRDVMELPGVQRGSPKTNPGADWQNAEQLREAELDAKKKELDQLLKQNAETKAEVDQARQAAAALEKRNFELKLAVEAELARIKHDREMQQAAAAVINAEIAAAKAEAAADRKAAYDAASAAAVDRKMAEADRATAASERSAVAADKIHFLEQQSLHQRQLELLARGADERNGLNLRQNGDGFAMYRERLSPSEQTTYDSKWPAAIVAIARSVARMLEQARELLLAVRLGEKALEERENAAKDEAAQLKRDQAAHQASVSAHQVALNNLSISMAKLETDEARLAEEQRKAAVAIASAQKRELEATAIGQVNEQWDKVLNALAPFAGKVTVDAGNKLVVDDTLKSLLPPSIASSLTAPAPVWVTKIITAQKAADELEKRTRMAEIRQREAEAAVIADRKRIERSRSILEAIVADRCTASVKNDELHLTHIENGKAARTDKVSLADLGSSVVYLVRLHAKMLEGGERISKLEQELRVELASLAQRYPDRADVLAEEQKAVEQKIQRAFDPNQVPPNGVGS